MADARRGGGARATRTTTSRRLAPPFAVAATSSSIETTSRVIVRVRSGAPGKSAGPGLRADLTIDTLADPDGRRTGAAHRRVARGRRCSRASTAR